MTSHRIRTPSSTHPVDDTAPEPAAPAQPNRSTRATHAASVDPSVASTAPVRGPRRTASRVALALAVLVLAGHLGATLLWSSAGNPVRTAVGEQTLRGYMLPFFQQSWSVFAPEPVSSDISLDVRAHRAGSTDATEWFTVTDRDIANGVTHHLIPSRAYLTNFSLARGWFQSYDALGDGAGAAVGRSQIGGDWRQALNDDVQASSTASEPTVAAYVDYEDALNRIASSVAVAQWGEVDDVQVRVRITPVTPFEQRADPVADPEFRFVTSGWRSPLPASTMDQGAIDVLYGRGGRS
ncbi:DUF5819 family protein [Frigoribacterium faeni]|uniref:Flavin-binding protein dodecin n=1 Tax=Frigoribacterium faeni TaxID=145483 RepID=A0A7W3JG29_9MICO|nr:DUF5819 family protein [Frigoribacterium faeni]MBA8812199.1 flavin-binding protein dodecin [Frigoribacterium faeni]GEK83702.1 hypothetical protein FFA01_20110 [Frigoribacterium faeni]